MKICIAGKNNIAIEILEYSLHVLCIPKNDLIVVCNQTDKGLDGWQRSLQKYAAEHEIKIGLLEDVYSVEDLIFLSLEFDRIIKPNKFRSKRLYNIHFSLLPKYKGMYTSIWPILNHDQYSGVTLHKIDDGIDTGDIIDQVQFSIELDDNARDLYFKYLFHGIALMKKNLERIYNNLVLESTPQHFNKSSYYSVKSINFNDVKIDLNQTAISIHNQISAYNFREYQVPALLGKKIMSSKILTTSSPAKPGTVLFETDYSFVLSTVDYDIVVYEDRVKELFKACEDGNADLINELIQIPKIVNVQNHFGWTPLIVATFHGKKAIVEKLIQAGADLRVTNFKGTTVLMYAKSAAVRDSNTDILELFLKLGMDIDQKDYAQKSVIDYCIENHENDVLNFILGYSK